MSNVPSVIRYCWVERDNQIIDGLDPIEKTYVTPYKMPRERASKKLPGTWVDYAPPADSLAADYMQYFCPPGFVWEDTPLVLAPTLGELCATLMGDKPLVYPPTFYAKPEAPYRYGALSLLKLLFDSWENTEFRAAVVGGGWSEFDWKMLQPGSPSAAALLACPTSVQVNGKDSDFTKTVRLRKVLTREPLRSAYAIARVDTPQVIQLPPKRKITMRVGFNYAWPANAYGVHMGPRLGPPKGADTTILPNQDQLPDWAGTNGTLDHNLKMLKDVGINLIRWFVLCNGYSYMYSEPGRFAIRPRMRETPNRAGDMWEERMDFEPPSRLHPAFERDFRLLLETVKRNGFQIIPSFVDFRFFFIQGVEQLMEDHAKRKRFFDTALEPLLKIAAEYREQIYAFEVINEPYWVHSSVDPNAKGVGLKTNSVGKDNVKAFLADAVARIDAAGLPSTVGHRFAGDIEDLSKEHPAKIAQFHYYPKGFFKSIVAPGSDASNMADLKKAKIKTADTFLGEFAIRVTDTLEAWGGETARLKDNAAALIESRLFQLQEEAQFQLALVWFSLPSNSELYTTDVLKLSPNECHVFWNLLVGEGKK